MDAHKIYVKRLGKYILAFLRMLLNVDLLCSEVVVNDFFVTALDMILICAKELFLKMHTMAN